MLKYFITFAILGGALQTTNIFFASEKFYKHPIFMQEKDGSFTELKYDKNIWYKVTGQNNFVEYTPPTRFFQLHAGSSALLFGNCLSSARIIPEGFNNAFQALFFGSSLVANLGFNYYYTAWNVSSIKRKQHMETLYKTSCICTITGFALGLLYKRFMP